MESEEVGEAFVAGRVCSWGGRANAFGGLKYPLS